MEHIDTLLKGVLPKPPAIESGPVSIEEFGGLISWAGSKLPSDSIKNIGDQVTAERETTECSQDTVRGMFQALYAVDESALANPSSELLNLFHEASVMCELYREQLEGDRVDALDDEPDDAA